MSNYQKGTLLGEKRSQAHVLSLWIFYIVHFADDAVYAPPYVLSITELTEAVVCLSAWHCHDESGRGGFADFDDDALRKAVPPELAQLIKQGVLHEVLRAVLFQENRQAALPGRSSRVMRTRRSSRRAFGDDDDVTVLDPHAGALCLQVLLVWNRPSR